MRKIIYLTFSLILFLFVSTEVTATERGELVYGVDKVSITNENINISGYAAIHGVNNYVKVYKRYDNVTNNVSPTELIADNGGQKVKILVTTCGVDAKGNLNMNCINDSNSIVKIFDCLDDEDKSLNHTKYNFYFEHFYRCGTGADYCQYGVDVYNNYSYSCGYDGYTNNQQCYYEDLYFQITFSVDELMSKFSNTDNLKFYIAASNNAYLRTNYVKYEGYTPYSPLKISSITGKSDYIEVTQGKANGNIVVVANSAYPQKYFNGILGKYSSSLFFYDDNRTYHVFRNVGYNGYVYVKNDGRGGNFLNGTNGPGIYAMCVNTDGFRAGDACTNVGSDGFCYSCNATNSDILYAFGSWITLTEESTLIIKVNNPNMCEVTDPGANQGNLYCNGSKTYSSTCRMLTITTSEGNADVKIEETGSVSSVLTPGSIYAGGGFNFGVMYYNTVKWSYIPGQSISDDLHKAVTNVMSKKIKFYDEYVAGINVTNLMLGGKNFTDLVKQCSTTSMSKDYYNKELTVSCVFTFPKAVVDHVGNVSYNYDSSMFSIDNKYYTPMDYSGEYNIEATIVGMDRITTSAAMDDSKVSGKAWTGNWSDTFTDCKINLYSLFIDTKGKYNFIYRPIDIYNPFPNRNAGINWFDWYNISRNVERLESTYSNPQYIVTLDNRTIVDIKNYNSSHNYLEWDSIVDGKSSFITEKDYIDRVGDNG